MRPKWSFVLEHLSLGVAVVLVAVGLVFFGSLLGYFWHAAHFSDLPAFGPPGYGLLVRSFPWWEVVVTVLGGAALLYLIRRHTKLYRWPLAATAGIFAVAFVAASWAAIATPLHDQLSDRAFHRQLPVVGPLYRAGRPLVRGLITPGTIQQISDKQWVLTAPDDSTVKVNISSSTRIDPAVHPAVGDRVIVIGRRDDDAIDASAIRSANDFPHRRPFFLDRRSDETNESPET